MWVDVAGWDDLGNTVGGDSDLPLEFGCSFLVGFEQIVVVFAQQAQVVQCCRPFVGPGDDVVGVTISGWAVAAGEDAAGE
ncbi:MAG: hypothetical protein QM619_07420, partial [Micropruina sp.]